MNTKLKSQIINCLICLLAMSSCNSKIIQTEEYIKIGDGGGFAGTETVYTLYKNGQVEQSGKLLGKLKVADVNQLFNNITILNLDKQDWNKPGNLYKFIEYKLKDKSNRLTWDSNAKDVNKNMNLYYDHMFYIINKIK